MNPQPEARPARPRLWTGASAGRPAVHGATVARAAGRGVPTAAFIALLAFATVLRRPDAVTHAQLWAEDGHLWFADAHNDGPWTAMVHPVVGYLQTISRLAGALAQPFGLASAPLIFNLMALGIQLLPAILVVSPRFAPVIPSRAMRRLLAAAYVGLPNSEIHGNMTNAQWHLALLALMVLVAAPAPHRLWRAFDVAVLVLAGLSGPFVLLLLPVAIIRLLRRRERWDVVPVALTGGLAALQGTIALLTAGGRSHEALGAGVVPAVRIVSDRIVIPALLAQENPALFSQNLHHGLLLAGLVTAAAGALLITSLIAAPWELRVLNGFALLTLVLALLRPQVSDVLPQWPLVAGGEAGGRYFLLPMVAWTVTVLWAVSRLRPDLRIAAGGVLVVAFGTGAALHWQYAPYADLHPEAYARRFEAAPPGTRVDIPINPPGWTMSLVRH